MSLLERIRRWVARDESPEHLLRGKQGEHAARKYLQRLGLKFLTANYRSAHGEIDLIFRDQDCLVFVEVKTRSSEEWTRPAAAVDTAKRRRVARTGLAYLRMLRNPEVRFRFDVVEVLLANGAIKEVRHIPKAFDLPRPFRYS
jgi:putative endonuclease